MVQDNQILHTFSTDINPGFAVPKNIQHLTGLTNHRLVKAPYFEDVALMIEKYFARHSFCCTQISGKIRYKIKKCLS